MKRKVLLTSLLCFLLPLTVFADVWQGPETKANGCREAQVLKSGGVEGEISILSRLTIDNTDYYGPTLLSTIPQNEATDVPISGNIILNYDKAVAISSGNSITDLAGDKVSEYITQSFTTMEKTDTVAKPTFSMEGGKLAISTTTKGADIYYSVKEYNLEPSGNGSLSSPYNVAGVLQYIRTLGTDKPSPDSVYIKGVVSSIRGIYPEYGNADFYITDNGLESGNKLFVFRIHDLGGGKITSPDVVKVGDEVIIHGKVTNYRGTTPETEGYSAYIYAITTPVFNTLYQAPLTIENNVIVRAKATKQGMFDSEMAMMTDAEHLPIHVPEGLVVEDYTLRAWHYRYYANQWRKFSRGQYQNNDEVLNIQIGFDGRDVYIQGFFDRFVPEAWVKGTVSEDETTVTFQTQYYGTDVNGYDHYLFGYTREQNSSGSLLSGDVVFQYDKATSTLRLPPSTEVADSKSGDTWMSWDYYDFIVITKGYQDRESLVVPPEGIHLEDYSFSASVVTYDKNNNIVETPTTFGVKVGFDGDDVYIKGVCQLMPEAWVKGSYANGKLTIPANQYVGSAENTEVFLTGFPVNPTDVMDLEDIIFDYDSDEKLFSGGTKQYLLVNASKVRVYYFTELLNVTITRLAEQSVKPGAPHLVDIGNFQNNSGYLRFNMPVTDIYDNALLEEKLYYQILVDDEHNISGYTFIPAKYETIESAMTLVPYTFVDNKYFDVLFNYETRVTDKIVYIQDEEPFTKNRIGIRSVYYGGGIENASDTTWYFIREFADVLAMNEARKLLTDEIEHANELLNDSTKARGKEELLSAISLAEQILENTTNPQDIGIINQAIETLQQAEEVYITLNLMIDTEEWMVLRDFYQSSNNGEGWTAKWDFSSNVPAVATLPGVTAYNGHVTKIDLSNHGLKGSFPVEILSLPYLEVLNLSNNRLTGNAGEAVDTYMQAHPNSSIAIKAIDISNNQLSGNIGHYVIPFVNLISLDASGNCFDEVTPMIPATVTTLNLGSQTIDRTLEMNLANLMGEYLISQMPNIFLYNHAQQTYSTNIRLLCSIANKGWKMRLISQNGQVSLSAVSGDNAFRGQSGDTFNVAVLRSDNTHEGSSFRLKLSFEQGDGNFDGQINVLDLQTTINYMFEEYTTKPFNFTAANLWEDNVINVQDAVNLVNLLLESESASARMQNGAKRASEVSSETTACVYVEDGRLKVSSAVPVASFDIVISSGQEWTMAEELSQIGFACMTRRDGSQIHLVGYSLNGTTLPVGQTTIGETGNGTVSYAMLADEHAQEIPSTYNSNTTGIQTPVIELASKSYRLSIGANRAIMIDASGKKTMIKNEK